MAIRFDDADPDVYKLLDAVIEEHFSVLASLEPRPTFDIRMAVDEKKPGRPAVKHHGHPVGAHINIIRPKERAAGGRDLRITIDYSKWTKRDDEERSALLFHELMHLEPKYDRKTGDLKIDPYGRPEFNTIPDDWMLTGFRRTVEVFGDKAPERKALDAVESLLGQKVLPFMKADAEASEATEKPKRRKAN